MVAIYDAKDDDSSTKIHITIRTLLSGGFIIQTVRREPGYMLFIAYRYDEFGTKQRYCFALADGLMGDAQIEGVKIFARRSQAVPVIVAEAVTDLPTIEWLRFVILFGGPVNDATPLDYLFIDHLSLLGFNKLPDGLVGKPDDLFEAYTRAALEFIFAGRVIRYGQERLFEARPDGLAIPNPHFTALYDAKAYSNGYDVTLNTVRQFSSYVRDFQRRYSSYRQRINAFIAVSGAFQQTSETLESRSRELISECNVPLAFITAEKLGVIITMLRDHPSTRRSINWARVFADPVVNPERVRRDINAVLEDGIVPE